MTSLVNIEKTCRTCKAEADDMYSLFDISERSIAKYSEMVMACASVQIQMNDGLPTTICVRCVDLLSNAYEFKRQCEQTDVSLRLLLKQSQIKLENFEEENGSIINGNIVKDEMSQSNINMTKKEIEEAIQIIKNVNVVFSCDICNKQFASPSGLKFHKRHHQEMGPNLTKCKVCNKDYSCTSHLQRHMRLHFPSKIYTCKLCNKSLSRLEHLKRHMIIHLKTKPHVCRTCKRGFNKADNLFNHEKKCKGQRPYICEICNRGFMREDSLRVHISSHDGATDVKPMLDSLDDIDRYICIEDAVSNSLETSSDLMKEDYLNLDIKDIKPEDDESKNKDIQNNNVHLSDDEVKIKTDFDFVGNLGDNEDDNLSTISDFDLKKEPNVNDLESIVDWNEKFETLSTLAAKQHQKSASLSKLIIPKQILDDTIIAQNQNLIKQSFEKFEAKCDECSKTFENLIDFDVHKQKHANPLTFNCKVCEHSYQRADHLRRHMNSHVNNKPFDCVNCGKKFTRKDHMLRHLKLHTEGTKSRCDLCAREFSKEELLIKHKSVKHGIGERVVIEKKFKCELCGKSFTTEKYREIHLKAHMQKEKAPVCKVCKNEFETKEELIKHLKQTNDCSRRFLCSECGQRFTKKDYLQVHMRRHRGEKPFKCAYCEKGFPRTTDLKAHEKCHTGEKTHLCVLCGKGFGRAYKLTLHMRTHTGEKPYQCTYCEAAFAQSNDLKAHIRRHTGERYHCDLCTDAFLMGYMLTQHKRIVHGVEVDPSQRPQPRINPNAIRIKPEEVRVKRERVERIDTSKLLETNAITIASIMDPENSQQSGNSTVNYKNTVNLKQEEVRVKHERDNSKLFESAISNLNLTLPSVIDIENSQQSMSSVASSYKSNTAISEQISTSTFIEAYNQQQLAAVQQNAISVAQISPSSSPTISIVAVQQQQQQAIAAAHAAAAAAAAQHTQFLFTIPPINLVNHQNYS